MPKITAGERMVKIETILDNIVEKIDDHVKTQKDDFQKVFSKFDNLKKDYAEKWVEEVSKSHAKSIARLKLKLAIYAGGLAVLIFLITIFKDSFKMGLV